MVTSVRIRLMVTYLSRSQVTTMVQASKILRELATGQMSTILEIRFGYKQAFT